MVRFLCLQMGNFVVKCSNGLQDYRIVKTIQIAKKEMQRYNNVQSLTH